MTDELRFKGRIIKGRGGHADLLVPGRDDVPDAPPDWPQELFPGSLNVLVTVYPTEFEARGLPKTVKVLDTAGFVPAFRIPQTGMLRNKLTPQPGAPDRGTGQVWRAELVVDNHRVSCWVLRRVGSGLGNELELVSGEGIRVTYGLHEECEWPAEVRMFGSWMTSSW